MRKGVIAAIVVPVSLLAGTGGYALADASDVVPGWITTQPQPQAPAPFIDIPAVSLASPDASPVQGLLNSSAPMPSSATIQAMAQALRDDPALGSHVNVSVIDVISGEVLADVGAADAQVPASSAKLLTAIAVVDALGPDATLSTVARYDAAKGELALVAGGDMLLAEDKGTGGDNPDVTATWGGDMPAYGYAGLGDLADQVVDKLRAQGVTSVKVVVDTSAFPGPAYPASWPAYAFDRGYAAPVTGLAVNVGKQSAGEYAPRYADPAAAAADDFAARLQERGISATRGGTRNGAGGDEVGRVESAPLSQVAAYMLHASDNAVAEDLTRVLAISQGSQAVPKNAMAAVVSQLQAIGVDTTGLILLDGAGYSDKDQVPPRVLTQALRLAMARTNTHDIAGWLAVSGLSGTLDDRFVGDGAAGRIRAKTGSLTGVTSLAGLVITQDGRPLVFAVMADGMKPGQDAPRTAIDGFASALAQCGCRS